jgi:hypothetical protein
MIKINLLPYQIIERRRVRSLMKVLGVVVLVEVAALGFGVLQLNGQVRQAQQELTDAKVMADRKRGVDALATALGAQKDVVNKWVIWSENGVAGVAPQYATLLSAMNEYIPRQVVVQTMTVAGPSMVIVGATDSMGTVAKYYRVMRDNPLVSGVNMSVPVPTWSLAGGSSVPGGGPMAVPITLSLVLRKAPPTVQNPPTGSISGGTGAPAAAASSAPTSAESYTGGEDQ